MTALLVAEHFGPTLQGEGPHAGRSAGFIRLGMCNLACSWCDTPYTWDESRYDLTSELTLIDADVLAADAKEWRTPIVVITGGEPLVQQGKAAWAQLLTALHAQGQQVHVETNGTIPPNPACDALVDHFSVSPKLSNAGQDNAMKPRALSWFAQDDRAIFKFVCATPADLDEVDNLVASYGIAGDKVWIMPEGAEPGDTLLHMSELADEVVARRWNLTTRLHVLCWGNTRGV